MPRAGSTVFQNIMAQNPDFYATPTSGVLELLFAARVNYADSLEFHAQDPDEMKAGFLNFCREGMKGFYTGITDKKYIIDKSRGWGIHYDFLNAVNPNPKIIVLVRDLRDIFASMEKNYRLASDKQSKILNWGTMQGTTTAKRVDIWAQTTPVGMAIERIGEMIKTGISNNVLFVKFEDLCKYPDSNMRMVYNFLELPYFEHDFENIETVTKEDDEVYGIYGDHKIRKNLVPVKSYANETLGNDISDAIYQNYKWYFDHFQYKK